MRSKYLLQVGFTILLVATSLAANAGEAWRGAGSPPCKGSDGGNFQCATPIGTTAVRAGKLFDSRTGQLLAKQIIVLEGDRIVDVGAEGKVNIPAGASVIDLSRQTVLPGLIDAHTHMFNNPRPGMSREMSTLIAIQNLQADLRAGFTTARDMTSHGN